MGRSGMNEISPIFNGSNAPPAHAIGSTGLAHLPWLTAEERAALAEAMSLPVTVGANVELVG